MRADNRFGKAVDKRRQEQQAIINSDTLAEEAKEEKKSENAPVKKDGAKAVTTPNRVRTVNTFDTLRIQIPPLV